MKKVLALFKQTWTEWNEDKAPRLGAALAYYTVFSLAPLLIIAIAVVGLVFGQQQAQDEIVGQIQGLVGPEGADLIGTMIENSRKPTTNVIATVLGLLTLLLGALGVFGQLQESLNTIWEVKPKPGRGLVGMVKDRIFSLTLVLGVGFLLLVSLVISAGLSAFGNFLGRMLPEANLILNLLNLVIPFVIITLLFALTFKFVPDAKIAWKDVWLGAALTALLFTVGKFLIGLYLGNASVGSTYGAAGSLVVILVWVYYSAQILFFGAEFTQVYANTFGSRVRPADDALPVSETERAQQGIPRTGPPLGQAEHPAPAYLAVQPADEDVVVVKQDYWAALVSFALGLAAGAVVGIETLKGKHAKPSRPFQKT
jgi:membrane protein